MYIYSDSSSEAQKHALLFPAAILIIFHAVYKICAKLKKVSSKRVQNLIADAKLLSLRCKTHNV